METFSITSIVKDSPAPVAIVDAKMNFIAHSQVWLDELVENKNSIIGKSYYDVLPNSPEEFKKIHQDCLSQGKSNQNKGKKFRCENGSFQWLKWKINAWKDENGQVGGLIIVLEDITETKRWEELLLKAEKVARIGGWEVDMITNTVYWTEVTKEIHEVPEDYVPNLEEGINFYKAGKHREEITRLVSNAISEGTPWDTELIIVTTKGKELWVRAKGEVEMVDGKCVRIYGTFQDIDEKKRYALNLREVNEKFAVAALGGKFGVFDYDLIENILVWDDSMYPLYGIDKDDFTGEYEAWQSCVHPDDLERCEKEIDLAVSGEKEFDTEFRVKWPNGEIRHLGGIAVIQRDADGQALRMIGSNWDVTELKTAQLMLEKSEESFEGAFENSAIGMALVDLKGQWIKANQSLCDSLGYTEAELQNLNIRDITHPDDIGKDLAMHKELSNGKRDSYQMEKRYYHKKGHEVYVILTVTAVRTKDEKTSHFISQVVDITQRIESELNFLEVTERLKIATKGANVGIWDYDIINNKLVWDDSMYLLYGIDKKDFKGEYEAWQAGLHPDDKKRGNKEIEMAISGEKEFDTEFRAVWPNGEIRYIKAIAVTQRDSNGKAIKMTGTNWDITELKTTQLMLHQSEESFLGAFENSNIGMAIVGLKGQWLNVNDSLCLSLGYTREELLSMTFQDITHPNDLNKDLALLEKVIKGTQQGYQMEKRYIHKKGRVLHAILTVTGIRDLEGNLSHFVSQVMDISEQKNSEKKLTELVKVTSEQNESLLNFAHIVSHNLRSHSSNLSMLTGFLSKEENAEEQKNLIHMLCDASESLNETILHLNEVVQVKVGALEKMKRINLCATLKNVEKNLSLLIQDKKAKCIIDVPEKHEIWGIPAYVDSIFLNLITNSIKYSSPERQPIIKIKSRKADNKVIMTFADNGLGIDLKRHGDKLFGMYKTFHRNKDAKGIGLFITKNQIEAMSGRIEVESTVGEGTVFTLYFNAK